MDNRFLNEQWAEAFVMYATGNFPTPSTDEGIRNLCNLRLDAIERTVIHMKMPASFAEEIYILRQHIAFVRGRLTADAESAAAPV